MLKLKIRNCLLSDLANIRYLQPDGWDDITRYFHFYCSHSFCHPVVALSGDDIVGVATGILNQNTGWLAHIISSPRHRRQGIGYQLTEHLVQFLSDQGCTTQLLIATAMGENLYRKFGFETVSQYLFFQGAPSLNKITNPQIRPFTRSDFAGVLQLDQQISGENRSTMLQKFLENAWVSVSETGQVNGFLLAEFGEGMILAQDADVGLELLELKFILGKLKTVVPIENRRVREFLPARGFEQTLQAPRMLLGAAIAWHPEYVFSRAGGFYG